MIGYKVMTIRDGRLRSGADGRQNFELEVGSLIRMPGKGVFVTPHRDYALDYYSGLGDQEVLLTVGFNERALITGNLEDKEPEVSVREVTILGIEHLSDSSATERYQ